MKEKCDYCGKKADFRIEDLNKECQDECVCKKHISQIQ